MAVYLQGTRISVSRNMWSQQNHFFMQMVCNRTNPAATSEIENWMHRFSFPKFSKEWIDITARMAHHSTIRGNTEVVRFYCCFSPFHPQDGQGKKQRNDWLKRLKTLYYHSRTSHRTTSPCFPGRISIDYKKWLHACARQTMLWWN